MPKPKPQRIRDPVHNLIEFGADEFEHTLWEVVQTAPFQRLRRIRQLGFSEFVFPGATHTRFAHSLGVFHVARQLMQVIQNYIGDNRGQQFSDTKRRHALAAALVHDIGHGMLSHAFEALGKEYDWPMARHENVSQQLILESEISEVFDRNLGKGFSTNVADIIAQETPEHLYGSVVSSQFDADRLDYMQRDRMMSGVESSGIDLTWLLANLEIAEISVGTDDADTGSKIKTLVLGPKAIQAAESYVLSLFHLYPNLYLHKATRGLEVLFQELMRRVVHLNCDGVAEKTGLPSNHPIIRFINDPENMDKAQSLDDTVFFGALPTMAESDDIQVKRLAKAPRDRTLTKCVDIRSKVESELPQASGEERANWTSRITKICSDITADLGARKEGDGSVQVFIDEYSRHPYKRNDAQETPLNQIYMNVGGDYPQDAADVSPVVAGAEPFIVCRAYVFRDDDEALRTVKKAIESKIEMGQAKCGG